MAPALGAISPHLDDLALSCAGLLAAHPGSSMVTVFAGGPQAIDPLTEWEAMSGMFEPGADIVGARRAEDRRAAELLGAVTVHLDHWDEQYRHAPYGYSGPAGDELVAAVAADLERLVGELGLSAWALPLGISHPDHEITAAAGLAVAERHPEVEWLVYEDLPYAVYRPGLVEKLLALLGSRGFELRPLGESATVATGLDRRRIVGCYESQVGSLGDGVADALATPERLRRLVYAG